MVSAFTEGQIPVAATGTQTNDGAAGTFFRTVGPFAGGMVLRSVGLFVDSGASMSLLWAPAISFSSEESAAACQRSQPLLQRATVRLEGLPALRVAREARTTGNWFVLPVYRRITAGSWYLLSAWSTSSAAITTMVISAVVVPVIVPARPPAAARPAGDEDGSP